MFLFYVIQCQKDKALKWPERVNVLQGAALGLAYLHGEKPPVVHHDISSYVIIVYFIV